MKTKLLFFLFFIAFMFSAFGQNNPVENLTFSQSYEYPNNFFELNWEEPAQPHNELLGYNIYRNDELFRFQTETTLYNLNTPLYGFVSNCGVNFLALDNQSQPYVNGFDIHVTAVYNPDQIESNYLQTVHCYGALLTTTNYSREKAILFPNPTNGLLNIGNINLEKIIIYDISGKAIRELLPESQIDLSNISKGLYIIKLFSEREIIIDKILIE
ncbi:T9SS type A sorting domain-containing protein [Flavobacterium sp.]|uniref:T9SS type A sorting domain-containing protein n=1 Tax=Flavobacterium sp. TaxID=239 RepID=UPI002FD9B975